VKTAKTVQLTERFWELRLAWLDGKYRTKNQKDTLIEELLKLTQEALKG